jgi:hypothetical protein
MITGTGTWRDDNTGRLLMIGFTHQELIGLATGLGPVIIEPEMNFQPDLLIEIHCGEPRDILDKLKADGETDGLDLSPGLREHLTRPHGKDCQC